MANVGIIIAGSSKSVLTAVPSSSELLVSTATSQQSANSVPAADANLYWSIMPSGGAVWVKFGSNPTAVAGSDWLLVDGFNLVCKASVGEKVAVINA